MRNKHKLYSVSQTLILVLFVFAGGVFADPLPGGTLDPLTIPQYVTPLVIPPVMKNTGTENNYDIAVRQFQQQILPSGLPPTTVWSYGPEADPVPAVAPAANSQFNYPAYTIETTSNTPVSVRWRNELVAINPATGFPCDGLACQPTFLSHLLPIDQTLHWANPPATGCVMGNPAGTDCVTNNPDRYLGPVPIITHVHGAHVESHSDGYPEAWYLPAASNIPGTYARSGRLFDDSTGTNPGNLGYVDFTYRNDQPATTIWYHDHSLGMTRANVYAGPAGFWLIRNGAYDGATDGVSHLPAVLPGPAPVAADTVVALNTPGDAVRNKIREIPIVIQDRSFNADGSLFYPDSRSFFDEFPGPYIPDPVPVSGLLSDISPIWNPEAFFNTMVVNGTTWPRLEVAPAKYRFRLLNGCNARFLNLALFIKHPRKDEDTRRELPFYQIGADQGFLPEVVEVRTGLATPLPGDGTMPVRVRVEKQRALLMGLAERADVIVDFSRLKNGTVVRMINTAPDEPFNGFPIEAPSDTSTTGRVMEFVVNSALLQPSDATTTSPLNLVMNAEPAIAAPSTVTRRISLNELESDTVCVTDEDDTMIPGLQPPLCGDNGTPAAPRQALLGTVDLTTTPGTPMGVPLNWTDMSGTSSPVQVPLKNGSTITVNVTENPTVGATETWEIYNFTGDAHPIHEHLVRFEVLNREIFDPEAGVPGTVFAPQAVEKGYKDTVTALPGQITRVKATYDISGLYVWHCHILEHEDNEMMRPYYVSP